MDPLLKGILTAFIMTLGIGPGMLINFHTSLRRGLLAGIAVVAGLYTSDFIFITINYFGVFHLVKSFPHQRTAGIVCGAIIGVLGIGMVMKKPAPILAGSDPAVLVADTGSLIKGYIKGFVVNMTNPFVFVFWMTLMGIATINFGFRTYPFHVYFATVFVTALLLDLTKSYFFSRMKTGIRATVMARINRGTGAVLASAGMVIICRSIFFISQP